MMCPQHCKVLCRRSNGGHTATQVALLDLVSQCVAVPQVKWARGSTAPGSSGSPLIDMDTQQVRQPLVFRPPGSR